MHDSTIRRIWRWGLEDATQRHWDMVQLPAWDAEEDTDFLNEAPTRINWVGYAEAEELRYSTYGDATDQAFCICGCGEPNLSDIYAKWRWQSGSSHLEYLANERKANS